MPDRQIGQSALNWRKSAASADGGNCVEIASANRSVLVRDSRYPSGTMLEFSPGRWTSFLRLVQGDNAISGRR